jgi:NADPH:quinone reductase-like Zn-dependent oxidoreductase
MKGKTVVITGGTSGIGEIAAERLAQMGARIVLIARDKSRGEVTLARLHEKEHSFVDVTWIVQPVAKARMRFQSCSIGQVDSMRRDIINGGPSIVAGRRAGCENATVRTRVCEDRPRRLRHAKKLLEKRAIIAGSGWEDGLPVLLR